MKRDLPQYLKII